MAKVCNMLQNNVILLIFFITQSYTLDPIWHEGQQCHMKDGTEAICRKEIECPWLEQNVTKNKTFNYIRDVKRCSFMGDDAIICCPQILGSRGEVDPNQRRKSQIACEEFSLYGDRLVNHISGGQAADIGEFPHAVALGYPTTPMEYKCGASLISGKFLLTAAHCCEKHLLPRVARIGAVALTDINDGSTPQMIQIKTCTVHPDFKPKTKSNDIAVIELQRPVNIEPNAYPACLYSNSTDPSSTTILSAEGWGATSFDGTPSIGLMKVNLTIFDFQECNKTLKVHESARRPLQLSEKTQFCALGVLKGESFGDTCPGDSGGPLQLQVNNRLHLFGITSYGITCGSKVPAVYTKVSSYLDWIESIVWP
uniref:Putative trypsin-like serine protease n=1 Tax=Corethrella appendiculata TaxID=1370023 RepID=U5EXE0_9DIPT